jgi:hypothetical protein
MMSKRVALLTGLMFLFMVFNGCGVAGPKMIPGQLAGIPNMTINYTANGEQNELSLTPMAPYTWNILYNDDTAMTTHADSDHPLNEARYLQVIERSTDTTALEIEFTSAPESYTVQCWNDDYLGQYQEYSDAFEWVDTTDNKIVLYDDNQGYVYVVKAYWPQGDAYFAFHVTNEKLIA